MSKQLERKHHEIDATQKVVGRLASDIAMLLRGKNKPTFSPHLDEGDFVTVVNAAKVSFTGRKFVQKDYYSHSMHPGGLRRTPMKKVFEQDPTDVIRRAVYGMLPKNKLRNDMMKRLIIKA